MEDRITFPEEGLEEGMPTASGEGGQMGQSNPQISEDMMLEEGMIDDELPEEGLEGEELPDTGNSEDAIEDITAGTEDEA